MSEHVDVDALAAFADGSLPTHEANDVRNHLTGCRSCMAAYADAVRYRAAWLAHPGAFAPGDDDRSFAHAVPRPPHARPLERNRRRPQRWRAIVPGLTFMAVLASVILVGRSRPPEMHLALPPAVLEAAIRSSAGGLVLPGTEQHAMRIFPGTRSGGSRPSLDLQREATQIVDGYELGTRNAEAAARVVVALLATGELDAAREYAREGLLQHPNDVRLLIAAADAGYRTNDLAGAEALLRRAAQRAPHDPVVALDMGLVLRQQGREDAARAQFERAARVRVAALVARAKVELQRSRAGS